eukprot:CAMPEP_0170196510 /NCGR_PEP_ID=MMETSP0040_2-20121228/64118_1 /TAXON_ID=641309 /ORGANISM="Lotharella oceanica, Strain CCMP622" /LENGTH=174 /DNA_ID=CAMNT_0010445941 /DNA_START=124 /DNA_END=644 /DNA_ORIENTATION=-
MHQGAASQLNLFLDVAIYAVMGLCWSSNRRSGTSLVRGNVLLIEQVADRAIDDGSSALHHRPMLNPNPQLELLYALEDEQVEPSEGVAAVDRGLLFELGMKRHIACVYEQWALLDHGHRKQELLHLHRAKLAEGADDDVDVGDVLDVSLGRDVKVPGHLHSALPVQRIVHHHAL